MIDLFFDRYGHLDWKVVGVAAFFAVVLPLRAWIFLRPRDEVPRVIGTILFISVCIVGGLVGFYLENQMDGFPFGKFQPVDLLPLVPIVAGIFFAWDIFIKRRDFREPS